MKLIPKDYIYAQGDLARAGFNSIQTLLEDNADGSKTPTDIAVLYGIDVQTVELVKTTSSYAEYQTIARLEMEREALQGELDTAKVKEASVKPKGWHYAIAIVILGALVYLIVWGIIALIHFIGGLS